MERYFEGDTFTDDEIRTAVHDQILEDAIVPVEMGSSTQARGIYTLLDDIVKYLPAPNRKTVEGTNTKTGAAFTAKFDDAQPKSAFIFKTIVDPFIGRYSLIKVRSGVFKTDDTVYDTTLESELRLGKLYTMMGKQTTEIPELHAGDIGAVAKLGEAKTGDTLSTKAEPIQYEQMQLSTPYTYIRYKAKNKNDIDKIAQAMSKISSEDPTFYMLNDSENGQTLIYGIGDMQLEVVKSMLANEYKVEIETMAPKVAYRETIRKNSDCEFKYKNSPAATASTVTSRCASAPPATWPSTTSSAKRSSAAMSRGTSSPLSKRASRKASRRDRLRHIPLSASRLSCTMAPTTRSTPPKWPSRPLRTSASRRASWMRTRSCSSPS